MAYGTAQADRINRMNADAQRDGLGTEVARVGGIADVETALSPYQLIAIKYNLSADASGAGLAITVPYAMEIVNVIVQARATVENGTVKLTTAAGDITNTIACATDTAVAMVGTIDDAKSSILTTTALKAVASGATVRGLITIIGYRS